MIWQARPSSAWGSKLGLCCRTLNASHAPRLLQPNCWTMMDRLLSQCRIFVMYHIKYWLNQCTNAKTSLRVRCLVKTRLLMRTTTQTPLWRQAAYQQCQCLEWNNSTWRFNQMLWSQRCLSVCMLAHLSGGPWPEVLQGCGMQVVLEGDCSFVVHHHSCYNS